MTEQIPVFVLTGFLGSGKTTLLRRLLAAPAYQDSAVIINELGEVGLDHDLVEFSPENIILMPGGCICCAVREDVEKSLRTLFAARDEGRIPPFSRLIIETTGVSEPLPLLATLARSGRSISRLQRPCVVTVVDGVLGRKTLMDHAEASAQIAHADILIISKPDLSSATEIDQLAQRIRSINPWARTRQANLNEDCLDDVFCARDAPNSQPEIPNVGIHEISSASGDQAIHSAIRTCCLVLERPLNWTALAVWMTMLLNRHGHRILRAKGILAIDGMPGPTIFHSAQHLVHPPVHMAAWPGVDRRSRLVFIVQGLDPELLEASLRAFDIALRGASIRSDDTRPVGAGGVIAGRPVRRPSTPAWIKG